MQTAKHASAHFVEAAPTFDISTASPLQKANEQLQNLDRINRYNAKRRISPLSDALDLSSDVEPPLYRRTIEHQLFT